MTEDEEVRDRTSVIYALYYVCIMEICSRGVTIKTEQRRVGNWKISNEIKNNTNILHKRRLRFITSLFFSDEIDIEFLIAYHTKKRLWKNYLLPKLSCG